MLKIETRGLAVFGDGDGHDNCRPDNRFRRAAGRRHSVLCLLAAFCALPHSVLPASAQPTYPDLRGMWTGTADQVMLGPDGSGALFESGSVTFVVSEQRDRRFAGELDVRHGNQTLKRTIVGVFTSQTEFAWGETEGFVNGRMIDDDTIETCYTQVGADIRFAACETMRRKK